LKALSFKPPLGCQARSCASCRLSTFFDRAILFMSPPHRCQPMGAMLHHRYVMRSGTLITHCNSLLQRTLRPIMLIRSAAMVPLLELFAPSGVELFVMAKRKHSSLKIATKLARANELATRGKLQSEIARMLGVSVMTLHRWRKALPGPQPAHAAGQARSVAQPARPNC